MEIESKANLEKKYDLKKFQKEFYEKVFSPEKVYEKNIIELIAVLNEAIKRTQNSGFIDEADQMRTLMRGIREFVITGPAKKKLTQKVRKDVGKAVRKFKDTSGIKEAKRIPKKAAQNKFEEVERIEKKFGIKHELETKQKESETKTNGTKRKPTGWDKS